MRSRRLLVAAVAILGLGGVPDAARAKVFLSQSEAIEQAFPDADRVEARTYVLDDEQARAVESLAKARLESRLVKVYTAIEGERPVGYALIDIHTVRTLPEAFLVVIEPSGEVRSLRVLAFYEPQEYRPSDRWLEQFQDEPLTPELRLQRKIHGIAGSTLSSRAVTSGVRRSLALWKVLVRSETAPASPPPRETAGALGGR